jgi:hypothetical protein
VADHGMGARAVGWGRTDAECTESLRDHEVHDIYGTVNRDAGVMGWGLHRLRRSLGGEDPRIPSLPGLPGLQRLGPLGPWHTAQRR